jgi:hypothetical protein
MVETGLTRYVSIQNLLNEIGLDDRRKKSKTYFDI